ncbi:MAG: hypothetical protein ACRCSP_07430 [Rhodoglobus sp.]
MTVESSISRLFRGNGKRRAGASEPDPEPVDTFGSTSWAVKLDSFKPAEKKVDDTAMFKPAAPSPSIALPSAPPNVISAPTSSVISGPSPSAATLTKATAPDESSSAATPTEAATPKDASPQLSAAAEPVVQEPATATTAAPTASMTMSEVLTMLIDVDGAECVALVDSSSGMTLGQAGSAADLEVAAASNVQVVRATRAMVTDLTPGDKINDLLFTLTTQFHIIRPLSRHPNHFIYLVLDRSRSNLAMARYKVDEADAQLVI